MTILRSLQRGLNNPTLPLSGSAIATWLNGGKTVSGMSVNEDSALGLTAYYSGLTLLAGTCAATPLRTFEIGTKIPTRQGIVARPHPDQTMFELLESVFAHICGWGNAYLVKIRNRAGAVSELWVLHPSRVRLDIVKPTPDNPAGKVFWVTDDKGETFAFTNHEILHIPGFSVDGKQGLTPVRYWSASLGVGLAQQEYTGRFFGSGSMMQGILNVPEKLNAGEADEIKRRWRDKIGGIEKAHEIAVIDSGGTFQQLSINPVDAQLLESRAFSVLEVARMLGIPAHLLNENTKDSSWGAGKEQVFLSWIATRLRPLFTRVEARLTNEAMPIVSECRFDLRDLERGDSAARAKYLSTVLQFGVMSRAEARDDENLPPAPASAELDKFMYPANLVVEGEPTGPAITPTQGPEPTEDDNGDDEGSDSAATA